MMEQRMLRDIRRGLEDEAGRFEAFVQKEAAELPPAQLTDEIEEFCHALPSSSYLEFRPTTEAVTYVTAPFRYAATTAPPHSHYEVLTHTIFVRDQPYLLTIGASRAEMHRALELLQTLLFSLVPVVIALSCFGGAW